MEDNKILKAKILQTLWGEKGKDENGKTIISSNIAELRIIYKEQSKNGLFVASKGEEVYSPCKKALFSSVLGFNDSGENIFNQRIDDGNIEDKDLVIMTQNAARGFVGVRLEEDREF